MAEETYTITEFRGLDDFHSLVNGSGRTRSMNNVVTSNNRILGSPGISKLLSISTAAATTPIISLMNFYTSALVSTLYRMTPTKIHRLNTGTSVWDDATGTDLTGDANTIPQFVIHKDTLVFTNEGNDLPRKLIATGNSATLGGSPPYAKGLFHGWGYLFLLNVSNDGITFNPRRCIYSDDFDNNWALCTGNELNFHETQGEIVTGATFGAMAGIFKTDGIIQLGFIGGLVRFSQDHLPFSSGILAPLSLAKLENFGLCFLGTDYRLHITDLFKVKTLPPFVQRKLDETMVKARAKYAVGVNFPNKDTYSLFYESAASDTWNRSRISFNYRTGEFSHRTYTGHEFVRVLCFRFGTDTALRLIASTSDLVYDLDVASATDDGTKVDRYYDLDWTDLGFPGEKYLKGVSLNAVKQAGGRISLSVASDYRGTFSYEKIYNLKSLVPSDGYVNISYRIDPGLKGSVFSIRIKLYHDDGTEVEVVPPAHVHFEPVSKSVRNSRYPNSPSIIS